MKEKYIILANSIIYDKELEIIEEDFTDSDLDDDDIVNALVDTCAEIEQKDQMNTLILTKADAVKLMKTLLS